ncbi:MAG: M23 family metallopeptidase [Bdellovibrionales bacterium]
MPRQSSPYFTVIVASNRGEIPVRFDVPVSWLKAGAFLVFCAVLFFATVAIDYIGLLPRAREHEILKLENEALASSKLVLEKRLFSLSSDLDHVQNLTEKLRRISKLGIDNLVPSDDGSSRAPASLNIGGPVSAVAVPDRLLDSHKALSERVEGVLKESQVREQNLLEAWSYLSDRQSLLRAVPSIKPVHVGYYSSPFGYRYDPINGRPLLHAGVDIASPWGTAVRAPADGVVSYVGYEGGYGNLVTIDHGYGLTTRFAHNSRILVHQGQAVKRWETISVVGSTGHSTGSHVHYEVRVHGIPVDPQQYILQDE